MATRLRARSSVLVGLCVFVGLGALCISLIAQAQPADAVAKVTQLNRDAVAAMEKREFEKARGLLKRALDICETSGLGKHPVTARTHVHMGIVIIEGFKNRELGLRQFSKAIEIEPGIGVTKTLSTPELEEAFAEARTEGGGGSAAPPAPPSAEDAAPRARPSPREEARAGGEAVVSGTGLSYHTVSEVRQGSSIVVTVNVEDSLKFKKIVLAYRPQGSGTFLGREMEPVGNGAYSASIPDSATSGSSVAYYIEAQNDDGAPIASRGTEERPLVISFAASARAPSSARASVQKRVERREEPEDEREPGENEGRLFASLLVGSGIGYASGTGEVNADSSVAGTFTGALIGHVRPELGYWVSNDLLLSVQGRLQWVSGPTELTKDGKTYSPVPAALAAFAKATYLLGSGDLRPFVSGAVGGGQIRHVVTFGNFNDCGSAQSPTTCVDSVVAGPFLVQAGGGLNYALTPQFGLILASNALVAAPKFTIHFDINAGVAYTF
jgi:hypothetical protein